MHLALWYVVLVCHQYDGCKNYVDSVYVGGYGCMSESGPCVLRELCLVSFLVVVSAYRVGGTRGSGIVSSAAAVLWMRGVGGVCEMCMCLPRGGVGGEGVSG